MGKKNCGILAQDNSLTRKGIVKKLRRIHHVKLSVRTVGRMLKEMGFRWKRLYRVPEGRNNKETKDQRKAFCLKLRSVVDSRLLYIDQSGVNQQRSTTHGYVYGFIFHYLCFRFAPLSLKFVISQLGPS